MSAHGRPIHLGGFLIAGNVTHSHPSWRHPRSDPGFLTPEYYQHLGRVFERAKLDFVFFADNSATPARYRNDIRDPLARGTQSAAGLDPRFVVPVVAGVTRNLGIVSTTSATFYSPYDLARSFATLDHLTHGRVGWNVVTSNTTVEAQNFGLARHLDHDVRYDRAEELLEVAFRLWASWDDGALIQDKEAGVFADPDLVHRLDHHGENFDVRGPLSVPRSPQGRPVIFQAGSSTRGRDFAARWAEAIFEIDPTSVGRKAYYDDIKSRASDFGRDPDGVKILPSFIPFVGETESIAREKQAFHNELADPTDGLITLSVHTDHDFSGYDLDAVIADIDVPGTKGLFEVARSLSVNENLTLRDIGKLYAQGVLLPQFVGTAAQVADQIEAAVDGGEADGFLFSAGYTPGGFEEFADLVIPELQRRGRFRTEYTGSTLREHLGLPADANLVPVPRKAVGAA
ncbi:LLM class flavin-dependent oxidoreductase [Gordonia desulfuricans]|uniref:LLM class flavin-dependent oxidoreductase n=1 Tax=Gordonia desulfuricans TaxID=89051 RepID=A0A7K3LP21_9ACTN|nr:LLM class flavin-dependent oxidoreductase [Gordonia desulfuricans]NDK89990.1 LLM class flavin-dependent oxidoreductase [Gordonia desulfuricans]